MVTLEETLNQISEWAVDRLHILCDMESDDLLELIEDAHACLLYTSPSPRDGLLSRMPSSA